MPQRIDLRRRPPPGGAAPAAPLPLARETPARLVVIRALPISEAFVLASETDQAGRRQGVRFMAKVVFLLGEDGGRSRRRR